MFMLLCLVLCRCTRCFYSMLVLSFCFYRSVVLIKRFCTKRDCIFSFYTHTKCDHWENTTEQHEFAYNNFAVCDDDDGSGKMSGRTNTCSHSLAQRFICFKAIYKLNLKWIIAISFTVHTHSLTSSPFFSRCTHSVGADTVYISTYSNPNRFILFVSLLLAFSFFY